MKRLSVIGTFLLVGSIFSTAAFHRSDPGRGVTMVSLLANPERYDGKKIDIIGYVHLEFEDNGLYLHKEDYDNDTGSVIWLDVDPSLGKKYNDKFVEVRGVFDAQNLGHLGRYQGVIKNVTLQIWSDPKHTIRQVFKEVQDKERKRNPSQAR